MGGVVTILSPCILPILPIVLSSGIVGGKKRPVGVVVGFVASFTFFTLALSSIVRATGLSPQFLRILSVVVVGLFGISLLLPHFQVFLEKLFTKFSTLAPKEQKQGFWGGMVLGLSLGLIWTPCVGPIIASVITLAATSTVTFASVLLTFSYALGTAIPMFIIILGGRALLDKLPWLSKNSAKIQKAFGVLMIIVAVAIYFNFDRSFQNYVLEKFPRYGTGLTSIEDNSTVQKELGNLGETNTTGTGKPMDEVMKSYPFAPELISGGEWFNSEPLQISKLRGKVILVDFWTYTCINCIRTLPYLRDWDKKYANDGLVIVGVHTPEFEFEKDAANVKKAVSDFELKYPIMQDNNYATWKAYNNHYWPAKYLIDKDGKIRYTHFGEGDYDVTEKKIQELLEETGAEVNEDINTQTYSVDGKTPETYLGYQRMAGFYSPETIVLDKKSTYSFPTTLPQNRFAFSGEYLVTAEYSQPTSGSKLDYNFEAKDVFLVMRPKVDGQSGEVKVYLDGALQKTVTVDSDKLYDLVKLEVSEKHELLLEFLDNNVQIFAFTFG